MGKPSSQLDEKFINPKNSITSASLIFNSFKWHLKLSIHVLYNVLSSRAKTFVSLETAKRQKDNLNENILQPEKSKASENRRFQYGEITE